MAQIQHASITDPNIHECKGAASATLGQVPIANGTGGAPFGTLPYTKTNYGYVNIVDLTTATTPIPLTLANTLYQLTNDTSGVGTLTSQGLPGMVDIWNSSTNYFDFSAMALHDVLDMRVTLEVVVGNIDSRIELLMEFGVGGTTYTIPIEAGYFKDLGTYSFVGNIKWPLVNTLTKNSPARLLIKSSEVGSSVKVKSWYIVGYTRG